MRRIIRNAEQWNESQRNVQFVPLASLDDLLGPINMSFCISGGERAQRNFVLLAAIARMVQDGQRAIVLHADNLFSDMCLSLQAKEGFKNYLSVICPQNPGLMPFSGMRHDHVNIVLEKLANIVGYDRLPAYSRVVGTYMNIVEAFNMQANLSFLSILLDAEPQEVKSLLEERLSNNSKLTPDRINKWMTHIRPDYGSAESNARDMLLDVVDQLKRAFSDLVSHDSLESSISLSTAYKSGMVSVVQVPSGSRIAQAYFASELDTIMLQANLHEHSSIIINDLAMEPESDMASVLRKIPVGVHLGLVSENIPAMLNDVTTSDLLLTKMARTVLFKHNNYVNAERMARLSPTYDKLIVEYSSGRGSSGGFFNWTPTKNTDQSTRYEKTQVVEPRDLLELRGDQMYILDSTIGQRVLFVDSIF